MANPTALLETSLGNITVELFTDVMPGTVEVPGEAGGDVGQSAGLGEGRDLGGRVTDL